MFSLTALRDDRCKGRERFLQVAQAVRCMFEESHKKGSTSPATITWHHGSFSI